MELLKSNASFHQFCLDSWHKHLIVDEILVLRYSKDELAGMSRLEKVRAVYQSTIEEQFLDTVPARQEHARFMIACSSMNSTAPPVSPDEKPCVQFVKALLVENAIYSVPKAVWEMIRGGEFGGIGPTAPLINQIYELSGMAQMELYANGVEELIHFTVENPAPEKRASIRIPHEVVSNTMVTLSPFEVISNIEGQQFLLTRSRSKLVKLDVRVMCRSLQSFLQGLFRWRISSVNTCFIAKPAAICNNNEYPMPAIADAQPEVQDSYEDRNPDPGLLPMVPIAQAPVASDESYALSSIHYIAGFGRQVPFVDLQGVDAATITTLVAKGAVSCRVDDFAMTQLALRQENMMQVPGVIVKECIHAHNFMMTRDPFKLPKLYHIFRLMVDGWLAEQPENAYTPASIRVFVKGLTPPISYFVALRMSELIFAKHVDGIEHNRSDIYYKILIRAPEDKIMRMLADLEAKGPKAARIALKRLRGRPVDEETTSSGEDAPPRPCIGDNPAEMAIVPFDADERVHWSETEWRRCIVTVGDLSTRVWFDNCSDTSRKRRGWSNCSQHGCGCIRFVHESRNFFAVEMLVWLRLGLEAPVALTRAGHLGLYPPPRDLVLAALPSATFVNF